MTPANHTIHRDHTDSTLLWIYAIFDDLDFEYRSNATAERRTNPLIACCPGVLHEPSLKKALKSN